MASLSFLFAPELFAAGVLGVALLVGTFMPLQRKPVAAITSQVRSLRRPKAGRHSLRRRILWPRRSTAPAPLRVTVREIAQRGLDDHWLAAGVFMADEHHGVWCEPCLADPAARAMLASIYQPDQELTLLYGIDAVVLATRMCDYPGHLHGRRGEVA